MAVLVPGEGNHENHHVNPATAKNALVKGEWDLGWWFIQLIGKNINTTQLKQTYHT